MNRERELVSLRVGGREFQRRMERISFFKSGRKRVPKANGEN